MKIILQLLRYGKLKQIWAFFSFLTIKIGGPKIAAYFSYLTIDWGDINNKEAILCLSRESFIKDIAELRKYTKYSYPMLMGGYTRFQTFWFPPEMQIQTFYQLQEEAHEEAIKLSSMYAYYLIILIQKKCNIVGVLSANFDYWQDSGFKRMCQETGIPFLVLSREHPIIPKVCKEVLNWYLDSRYKFHGTGIAVAGQSTKKVLLNAKTICAPKNIVITGLPRYDAWRKIDNLLQPADRPLITLLTFSRGYYADDTFKDVLQLFCRAALKNADESVHYLIKTKDIEDTIYIKNLLYNQDTAALIIDHEINLFDALPKSRLVINYNSLSLVEAVMAKANIVIPAWGQCKDKGEKTMYSIENAYVRKIVRFAYTQDELLELIKQSHNPSTYSVSDSDMNLFINEYIHMPKSKSYCAEFEEFLSSFVNSKA